MRRQELIKSSLELANVLEELEIPNLMYRIARSKETKRDDTIILLGKLKSYSIIASRFNDNTKKIIDIFELHALEDEKLWAAIVDKNSPGLLFSELSNNLIYTSKFLPKFIDLLEQNSKNEVQEEIQEENSKYFGKAFLTVFIGEPENRFSKPERIVEVLEAVSLLYETCAILNDLSPDELSVVACDSGSDKSFDFLGAAKCIEMLKEILLSMWDRVVFYRENKTQEKLKLIAESLPIIDEIGNLANDEKISPEQAELLRRNIFDGIGMFIKTGATVPEMDLQSHQSPEQLMTPETKLLVSAPEKIEEEPKEEEVNSENEEEEINLTKLSEEQQEAIKEILKNIKMKNSDSEE